MTVIQIQKEVFKDIEIQIEVFEVFRFVNKVGIQIIQQDSELNKVQTIHMKESPEKGKSEDMKVD